MKKTVVVAAVVLAAVVGAWLITLASEALGAWTAPAVLLWLLVLSKAVAVVLALGHSR
jgi:hypothetical protein